MSNKSSKSKEYSFNEDQKHFYADFMAELIRRMTPLVEDLVTYIRQIETLEAGLGKAEIDKMLEKKQINQPMYEILIDSIQDLTTEYKVNLAEHRSFKSIDLDTLN